MLSARGGTRNTTAIYSAVWSWSKQCHNESSPGLGRRQAGARVPIQGLSLHRRLIITHPGKCTSAQDNAAPGRALWAGVMPGGRDANRAGAGWAPWQEEAPPTVKGRTVPGWRPRWAPGPSPRLLLCRVRSGQCPGPAQTPLPMEAMAQSPRKVFSPFTLGGFHSC